MLACGDRLPTRNHESAGRTHRRSPKRRLYLNLRGRSKDESRDLLFDFRFLTDKEAEESKKDVYWFRVGDVLDLKSQFQVNNYLIKNGLMKEEEAKAQFANETLFK